MAGRSFGAGEGWICSVLVGLGAISLLPDCMNAQPVADTTLGAEQSIVTPFSPAIDRIDGGATRGINLFHSFRAFNIGAGQAAYFFVPSAEIQNVLARVTGTSRSEILGTLGVRNLINNTLLPSNANLFLINPNGIIFGPGARLDVGGSFVATTANAIQFGDLGSFSATVPSFPALLTVNPSAFFFNQVPSPIRVNSQSPAGTSLVDASTGQPGVALRGLRVTDGRSLLLLGGGINIDYSGLTALGGRVELGGIGRAGIVGLTTDNNNLQLHFPNELSRADVSITNGSRVDVIAGDKGSVVIMGQNVEVSGRSGIFAGIGRGLGSVNSKAGDISLDATARIRLSDSAIVNAVILSRGATGDVNLSGQSVDIVRSQIGTTNFGDGDAGDINIQATDTISLSGTSSGILSNTVAVPGFTAGFGNGGDIILAARTVSLADRASITTNTFLAPGNSGNIRVTVLDDLSTKDGSLFSTSTFGLGNAGNITIKSDNTIRLDGMNRNGGSGGFKSTVEAIPGLSSKDIRTGGNISVETGSLTVANGAEINSSTEAVGDAGNVAITVRGAASFDGIGSNGLPSRATTQIGPGAVGKGGTLTLNTGSLSVTNGALLSSSTFGQGSAGDVTITVRDAARFDGVSSNGFLSGAGSQVGFNAIGKGGTLTLNTGSLSVTNGATLSSSTFGQGNAGDVTITVRDAARFDGVGTNGFPSGATDQVDFNAIGKGGTLTLNAGSLSVTNGALLSSSTLGQGNAGDVTITIRDAAQFDGVSTNGIRSGVASEVDSNAVGKGGTLTLNAGSLSITNGALLSSSASGKGDSGDIVLRARDTLRIADGSISTFSLATTGGAVNISARSIRLLGSSNIITSVFSGVGGGGNITLTAQSIIALNDSNILAFARDGKGGNISLNTRAFFGQNYRPAPPGTNPLTLIGNNRVDVNASGAVSGIITIPDTTFIQNSLNQLPQTLIDTTALLVNSCIVRRNQPTGNFFITGSGGLPERPGTASSPAFPTGEVQNVKEPEVRSREPEVKTQNSALITQNSSARRPWKIGDPIVEPQGVYQLPDGQLVLSHECQK